MSTTTTIVVVPIVVVVMLIVLVVRVGLAAVLAAVLTAVAVVVVAVVLAVALTPALRIPRHLGCSVCGARRRLVRSRMQSTRSAARGSKGGMRSLAIRQPGRGGRLQLTRSVTHGEPSVYEVSLRKPEQPRLALRQRKREEGRGEKNPRRKVQRCAGRGGAKNQPSGRPQNRWQISC